MYRVSNQERETTGRGKRGKGGDAVDRRVKQIARYKEIRTKNGRERVGLWLGIYTSPVRVGSEGGRC
jgi:hypothetical protein